VDQVRGLAGLRLIWLATVMFLPLYAWVGVVLRRSWPARDPAVLAWLLPVLVGLGLALGAIAIGIRPLMRRFRAGYGQASLVAWLCAEAMVLCGLVLWVEGGPIEVFGAFALAYAALMAILVPTAAASRHHDHERGQR
jgi:hypothetical protein